MPENSVIKASLPIFKVSSDLRRRLEAARSAAAAKWKIARPDEIESRYNAFLLDPGLGPATYLSYDGRILWEEDLWDVRGTRAEAFAAIVVGARKTGVFALRGLLPPRDAEAFACEPCKGTGIFRAGRLRDVRGEPVRVVCFACGGLGWKSPEHPMEEVMLDPDFLRA